MQEHKPDWFDWLNRNFPLVAFGTLLLAGAMIALCVVMIFHNADRIARGVGALGAKVVQGYEEGNH